jgi:nucleoid DNA-binding protein
MLIEGEPVKIQGLGTLSFSKRKPQRFRTLEGALKMSNPKRIIKFITSKHLIEKMNDVDNEPEI